MLHSPDTERSVPSKIQLKVYTYRNICWISPSISDTSFELKRRTFNQGRSEVQYKNLKE